MSQVIATQPLPSIPLQSIEIQELKDNLTNRPAMKAAEENECCCCQNDKQNGCLSSVCNFLSEFSNNCEDCFVSFCDSCCCDTPSASNNRNVGYRGHRRNSYSGSGDYGGDYYETGDYGYDYESGDYGGGDYEDCNYDGGDSGGGDYGGGDYGGGDYGGGDNDD